MRKHFVEFYSPGTLVPEQTRKPIDSWDTVAAVELANSIVERYSAKPYGFKFITVLTADPVPDGEGGMLAVEPKEVARSGTYFLGGNLQLFDDIPETKVFSILRFNMGCNNMPVVIENHNSWSFTGAFHEDDRIIDADGSVTRRGNDPDLLDYRKEFARRKAADELNYH